MREPRKDGMLTSDLVLKITGTIVAVVVSALALTTVLNALRLQQTLEELLVERLAGIAGEVRSLTYRGLDIGLPLSAMDNLPAILAQYAAADPHILSITVHDCAGTPIAAAPSPVAPSPMAQPTAASPWMAHLGTAEWHATAPRRASLGLVLQDGLGHCAGGVAVTYDTSAQEESLRDGIRTLIVNTLLAGLAAVPTAVATSLLLARRRRSLMAIYADLDSLDTSAAPSPQASRPEATAQDAAGNDVTAAYWAARPALAGALQDGSHSNEDATITRSKVTGTRNKVTGSTAP